MGATRYGIDVGQALQTAERIKGARLGNILAKQRIKGNIDNVKSQEAIGQARGQAMGGGEEEIRRYASLDPSGAKNMMSVIDGLDNKKAKAAKARIEDLGQSAGFILNGGPENEAAQRYALVRNAKPELKLDEQYDQQKTQMFMSSLIPIDKMLDIKIAQVGGEDVVYKGGREIERKKRPVKAGGKGGLKVGDESFIYRLSAKEYGGIFNDKMELIALDPKVATITRELADMAISLYNSGKAKTRANSVTMAKNIIDAKGGVAPTKQTKSTKPKDGGGIRDWLLK